MNIAVAGTGYVGLSWQLPDLCFHRNGGQLFRLGFVLPLAEAVTATPCDIVSGKQRIQVR